MCRPCPVTHVPLGGGCAPHPLLDEIYRNWSPIRSLKIVSLRGSLNVVYLSEVILECPKPQMVALGTPPLYAPHLRPPVRALGFGSKNGVPTAVAPTNQVTGKAAQARVCVGGGDVWKGKPSTGKQGRTQTPI